MDSFASTLLKVLILIILQFFVFAGMYEYGYYFLDRPQIWGLRVVIDYTLCIGFVAFIINAVASAVLIIKDKGIKSVILINCLIFLVSSLILFSFLFSGFNRGVFLVVEIALLISGLIPALAIFVVKH